MYSHIMKEEWVLEYLESDKFPNTELVMWCDAGDVIFIDSPQRIIDVFYEYDCDLLYSTTAFYHGNKGGYHDDFMEGSAKWQNNLKPGLYLNAGVVIGRVDFAKEVLREMLEFKWLIVNLDYMPGLVVSGIILLCMQRLCWLLQKILLVVLLNLEGL